MNKEPELDANLEDAVDLSRRQTLQSTSSLALWGTPVVAGIILPAHAQTIPLIPASVKACDVSLNAAFVREYNTGADIGFSVLNLWDASARTVVRDGCEIEVLNTIKLHLGCQGSEAQRITCRVIASTDAEEIVIANVLIEPELSGTRNYLVSLDISEEIEVPVRSLGSITVFASVNDQQREARISGRIIRLHISEYFSFDERRDPFPCQ